MRGIRMPPELEAKIDAWIERQEEPKPSRSEAIRRLIERGLAVNLPTTPNVAAAASTPGSGS